MASPSSVGGAGRSGGEHRSDLPYQAFALVYDRLMADMPYEEWFEWLEWVWIRHGRPASVIDLGCGTGTIAIPLAQSGIDVTGLDVSESMLSAARHKEASFRGDAPIAGRLRWVQGDLRNWSLPEQLEGALSLCDCLNYVSEESGLLSAFRKTYEGLGPGGWFLFDMLHRNHFEQLAANEPFCLDEEDLSYIWTCVWHAETESMEHRLSIFVREGERYARFVESHVQRYYSESLIRRLLAEAGFQQVEAYADFTLEPIDEATTERMFFAACKAPA